MVQCSGTLIGTSHVLTAGHCVVNTDSGEVISGMQYWPAFNGNDEPFQPITVSRTRVLSRFANQTTVSTASLNYDFALLTLSSDAPAGTAELAVVAGTGEQRYDLTTAGYPGVLLLLSNIHSCCIITVYPAQSCHVMQHDWPVNVVMMAYRLVCTASCLTGGACIQVIRTLVPCGPPTAPMLSLILMGLAWR